MCIKENSNYKSSIFQSSHKLGIILRLPCSFNIPSVFPQWLQKWQFNILSIIHCFPVKRFLWRVLVGQASKHYSLPSIVTSTGNYSFGQHAGQEIWWQPDAFVTACWCACHISWKKPEHLSEIVIKSCVKWFGSTLTHGCLVNEIVSGEILVIWASCRPEVLEFGCYFSA